MAAGAVLLHACHWCRRHSRHLPQPLHYWMASHLYRDVILVCGADGSCFLKNDGAVAGFTGTYSITALNVATGATAPVSSGPVSLARGAGAMRFICASGGAGACPAYRAFLPSVGCSADGSDCVLLTAVTTSSGATVDSDVVLLTVPSSMKLPAATVTFSIGAPHPDSTVPITVSSTATALFVTLTTLAQGRFSDNAFLLPPGAKTISFIPFGTLDLPTLQSSTRVEHVRTYI
jgi:beta-mannosidase